MSFGRKYLLSNPRFSLRPLKERRLLKVRLYQTSTLINYTFILFSDRSKKPPQYQHTEQCLSLFVSLRVFDSYFRGKLS